MLGRRGGDLFDIVMFGDEPYGNYNRILLSSVLSRTHDPRDIFINSLDWYAANEIRLHAGVRVTEIGRTTKAVYGTDGVMETYDKLVIATGSRPFIPSMDGLCRAARPSWSGTCVPGINRDPSRADMTKWKEGIFVFRTLDDCDAIMKYAAAAQRVAVIGGGLLGLEAARGLLNMGLEVHVVHLMPHLMEMQLDAPAGSTLKNTLEQMGVRIHLEKATTAIQG